MKYKILTNHYTDVKHPVTKKLVRLYRILALKTFTTPIGEIPDGSIGGFIQSEVNLSQDDTSWVYNQAKLFDDALLIDSVLLDDAAVFQRAIIEKSTCRLYSRVYGDAHVVGSEISNNATVYDKSKIANSKIFGFCQIFGNCQIDGSVIHDGVVVRDNSIITKCILRDTTTVKGVSNITNCHYSGHSLISNVVVANETKTADVDLKIEQNIFSDNQTAFK